MIPSQFISMCYIPGTTQTRHTVKDSRSCESAWKAQQIVAFMAFVDFLFFLLFVVGTGEGAV